MVREGGRDTKQKIVTIHGSHLSFCTLGFSVVGFLELLFWGYHLYAVQVLGIQRVVSDAIPITWGDL